MKISTFAIGIAAGAVLGAAAAIGAENMMPSAMKRDIKNYANKGMHAVSDLMH